AHKVRHTVPSTAAARSRRLLPPCRAPGSRAPGVSAPGRAFSALRRPARRAGADQDDGRRAEAAGAGRDGCDGKEAVGHACPRANGHRHRIPSSGGEPRPGSPRANARGTTPTEDRKVSIRNRIDRLEAWQPEPTATPVWVPSPEEYAQYEAGALEPPPGT